MEKKRKTIYSRHISFHLRRTWRLFRSASENSRLCHSLDALRRSRECNRNKKYKTRLLSEARVSTRRGSLVGQEFTFVEEARKREFDREGGERSRRCRSKGEFHSGFSTRKLDRRQAAGQSITRLVLLLAST